MTRILANGFTDTLRYFYPERDDIFTWWSYMKTIRERNIGWRIDYFIVSSQLEKYLKNLEIYRYTLGSDHCPVCLEMNLEEN